MCIRDRVAVSVSSYEYYEEEVEEECEEEVGDDDAANVSEMDIDF